MVSETKGNSKAVVLFSGGVDSTTMLAMLLAKGVRCYALTIDYGQRNRVEIQAAKRLATTMGVADHKVVTMEIGSWGGSSLTDHQLDLPAELTSEIPNTYVPARNTIFLAAALGWAEAIGAQGIYIGANQDDYAHYPDCRPEYFSAFNQMIHCATKATVCGQIIQVYAPLLNMSKKDIIYTGMQHNIDFSSTVTCYDPNKDGLACKVCEACQLRQAAFNELEN